MTTTRTIDDITLETIRPALTTIDLMNGSAVMATITVANFDPHSPNAQYGADTAGGYWCVYGQDVTRDGWDHYTFSYRRAERI